MNRILLALLLVSAAPAQAANSCAEATRPVPVTCAFGEVLTRDPLGLRCVVLASTVTQMAWEAITNKPVDYHPSSHTHLVSDIEATGTPSSSTILYGDGVWRVAPAGGGGGGGGPVYWSDVLSRPATFPPVAHQHPGTDVTGTVGNATYAATAGAASSTPWTGVTGKPSTFAPSGHTHDAVDLTSGTLPSPRLPSATSTAKGAVLVPSAACDAATQKAVWNGTAFACVTDQAGGGSYTLPAATASVLGGVKGGACASGYVVTGFGADGTPTCSAIGAVLANVVTANGSPPADANQAYWIDANTGADVVAPSITAFTMPGAAASLTVNVSSFTAADAVGVTGYMVKTASTPPVAGDVGWASAAPASVTASSSGAVNWYAFVKDAAGNVSGASTASTTITLSDTTPPVVYQFTLGAPTGLTVPITAFSASDAVGVTHYAVSEGACPAAGAGGWNSTAASSYGFGSAGTYALRGCAKDAAGNVSVGLTAGVTVAPPVAATPTFSPVAGAVTGGATVTISTATAGCGPYIYWNTTGSPTTSSTHTTSAVISMPATIYAKVIGCPGYADSSVASAAYTTTYANDFSNAATLAADFTQSGGAGVTWSVSGGGLHAALAAGTTSHWSALVTGLSHANGFVQADMRWPSVGDYPELYARTAGNNFILVIMYGGAFGIWENNNGTWANIGSPAITNTQGTYYTMKLQVSGSTVTLFRNGSQVWTGATSVTQAGLWGVGIATASAAAGTVDFDNLSVQGW